MFDKNKYLHLFSKNNIGNMMIIERVIGEIEKLTLPVLVKGNKEKMYKVAERFLWIREEAAYRELLLDIERLYSEREKENKGSERLYI